ncbi:unnamed protein product [Calypogeia fissa]
MNMAFKMLCLAQVMILTVAWMRTCAANNHDNVTCSTTLLGDDHAQMFKEDFAKWHTRMLPSLTNQQLLAGGKLLDAPWGFVRHDERIVADAYKTVSIEIINKLPAHASVQAKELLDGAFPVFDKCCKDQPRCSGGTNKLQTFHVTVTSYDNKATFCSEENPRHPRPGYLFKQEEFNILFNKLYDDTKRVPTWTVRPQQHIKVSDHDNVRFTLDNIGPTRDVYLPRKKVGPALWSAWLKCCKAVQECRGGYQMVGLAHIIVGPNKDDGHV